jgi:hypothetical protein
LAKFKGTVYLTTQLFTEKTFGQQAVVRCLESLQPEERRVLESITAVGWYPVEPILSFHRALESLYGTGDLTLCEKLGEFSAEWSVNTILKVFLKFKSPTWVLEKHNSVWTRYHDSGRWELTKIDHGVIGKLVAFEVADELFCARLRGWLRAAIRLTGGKEVKTEETRCKSKGAAYCEFKSTWI